LQVIFGGHRPPLQVAICKTTLKLHIAAVATGVERRKYIFYVYHPVVVNC